MIIDRTLRKQTVLRKGDGDMKEKKRVWFTFNLCEADAFEQYLEKMALQGWFLESVGGAVMRFYRAQPEKRRYAALLVPESSSLIGADDWKAEQLREQCEEAGWIFQCNSIYWQTVSDPESPFLELVGEIFLSYLGCIRNMGCVSVSAKSRETVCRSHAASFDSAADRYDHFLGSDVYTAVSLESWKYGGHKEGRASYGTGS